MKSILGPLLFFLSSICFSQNQYAVSNIPDGLKKGANSVVQKELVVVEIASPKQLRITNEIVITVLNKNGNRHLQPFVNYDKSTKVKSVEAYVYDADGEEIEKFKRRDFIDLSAVDGGTLYSDNRVLAFSYDPSGYPYTVVFRNVVESGNTAYIRPFYPLQAYNSSVMESSYSISWEPGVSLKHKIFDDAGDIQITEGGNRLQLVSKDLPAMERESHSLSFNSFAPHVLFSMDTFYLEGVRGTAHDWDQFGKWIHNSLLNDVSELSEATVSKVRNMVNGDYSLEEKARLIYDYVQKNTRYISVQIGIGGWKPMPADEVDNVGYGDCKALTNYTKTLLAAADIPSYYTVVYGSDEKRNILHDFPSLQGNHVILAVPNEDDTIWLECTSQDIPFGFLGDFTDDRDVLMVTPEGGKIVRTDGYDYSSNYLITKGTCVLDDLGNISVKAYMESSGIQYDNRYRVTEAKKDRIDRYYKNYWDYIDNISLNDIEFENDRKSVMLKENLEFDARSYAGFAGNDMILNVNVLNRSSYIPKRYKDRKRSLNLSRGFKDEDEVIIKLPEGFAIKALPEPIKFESEFGKYSSEVIKDESGDLTYRRTFELHEGVFPKESYDGYRKFRRKVAKSDNQKLIVSKI